MRLHGPIVALLLISTAINAHASKFARANVYFVLWFIETFVAMRPEDVRKAARDRDPGTHIFHVISSARIAELLRVLDLGAHCARSRQRWLSLVSLGLNIRLCYASVPSF